MFEVALTGNRFSGKESVAKEFRKVGIPVFDADIVTKFIINYRDYIMKDVKTSLGVGYFSAGFLNPDKFKSDKEFDSLLDLVDFDLFDAYFRFKEKHKNKDYIIFKSSLLFERKWKRKFNFVISVFATRDERFNRFKVETNLSVSTISDMISSEYSDLMKNQESDFTIHNYSGGPDLKMQIDSVNTMILNKIKKMAYSENRIPNDSIVKNLLTF